MSASENRTHLERYEAEPQDWIRIHKGTRHVSRCTRSTVLHRLYTARPDLDPGTALTLMDSGGPFETAYAIYQRGPT